VSSERDDFFAFGIKTCASILSRRQQQSEEKKYK
jgi:hypothetical protein